MEVLCESCKAKFKIPDEKLPAGQVGKIEIDTRPGAQAATPTTTPKTPLDEVASDTYDASEKPFDFVEEGVETALICEQDKGIREKIRSTLQKMDYHVTEAASARDALKFMRFHVFDLVMLDENFDGASPESNLVLQYLKRLPMNTRRNIFVLLLGQGFRTGDNMMAFNKSVNLVANLKDIDELEKVLVRSLKENEEFYRVLKESLKKVGRA
ncbi:MAG: hypothetical protein JRI65_10400 [Deltaproteobacteria bacterium]|nr:hypothetical protein [Deltaproteobacteria bacterium]